MAVIQSSFQTLQIRLSNWHMLKSMRMQIKNKIETFFSAEEQSTTQIRNSVVYVRVGLIHLKTIKEFGQIGGNSMMNII